MNPHSQAMANQRFNILNYFYNKTLVNFGMIARNPAL
jgi:hypothetical protein